MTQKSYFHDGVVHGDADLTTTILLSGLNDTMRGGSYVSTFSYGPTALRLYYNGTPGELRIDPGYAIVGGYTVLINAATDLTIPTASVGTQQWNRVILRVDKVNETASLVVLEGLNTTGIPKLPVLQEENECVVEMPLWKIFGRSGTSNHSGAFYDERIFWDNTEPPESLMRGSMWAGAGLNGAPPYCDVTGSPTFSEYALQEPVAFGQFLQVDLGAGDEFSSISPAITANSHDRWITYHFYARSENGVGYFSKDGGLTFDQVIPNTDEFIEFVFRYLADNTNTVLQPTFGSSSGCTMYISPLMVTYGLTPLPFIPREEQVLFWEPLTLFNGAITDGHDDVGSIVQGLKSILMTAEVSDSASAASAASVEFSKTSTGAVVAKLDVEGLPNDTIRCSNHYVEPYWSVDDWLYYLNVTTSGTLTANLRWTGMVT